MCLKTRRQEVRLYQAIRTYKNALKEKRREIKDRHKQLKEGFNEGEDQYSQETLPNTHMHQHEDIPPPINEEAPLANPHMQHFEDISPLMSPINHAIAPPNTPAQLESNEQIEMNEKPRAEETQHVIEILTPAILMAEHQNILEDQLLSGPISVEIVPAHLIQLEPQQPNQGLAEAQNLNPEHVVAAHLSELHGDTNENALASEAMLVNTAPEDPQLENLIQLALEGADIGLDDELWLPQCLNEWPKELNVAHDQQCQSTVENVSTDIMQTVRPSDAMGSCSTI